MNLGWSFVGLKGANLVSDFLTKSHFLTTLNLKNDFIGPQGGQSLFEALKTNNTLTSLSLDGNNIGPAVSHLSQYLSTNSTLKQLDLRRNNIEPLGGGLIGEALRENGSLVSLNIKGNRIGMAGCEGLAEGLRLNCSLTYLNVGYNRIPQSGCMVWGSLLKVNRSLTKFVINGNDIFTEGAQVILDGLSDNLQFTLLKMKYCKITEKLGSDISMFLKTHPLKILGLGGNTLTNTGTSLIFQALSNNDTLTSLDLSDNGISSFPHTHGQALLFNTSLRRLSLSNNKLEDQAISKHLTEALLGNTTLVELDVSNNSYHGQKYQIALNPFIAVNVRLNWPATHGMLAKEEQQRILLYMLIFKRCFLPKEIQLFLIQVIIRMDKSSDKVRLFLKSNK
uniref:Uncharacterized protein n=1 Tax=Arcella intermedia TaxID=1963864 RepID=A0A6B2L444_9EUKA